MGVRVWQKITSLFKRGLFERSKLSERKKRSNFLPYSKNGALK